MPCVRLEYVCTSVRPNVYLPRCCAALLVQMYAAGVYLYRHRARYE